MKKPTFDDQDQNKYKIILVGDSSVGKTALFSTYINGEFPRQTRASITTIDFKMKTITLDNQLAKLYIWDTAGQEKYRSIVGTYFKGCHGAFIVFDLTNEKSYKNAVNQWLQLCQYRAPNCEIFLIGNKEDLCHQPDGETKIETVNEQEIHQFCREKKIKYMRVSAKTGLNVDLMFNEMVGRLLNQEKVVQKTQSFGIDRANFEEPRSNCC